MRIVIVPAEVKLAEVIMTKAMPVKGTLPTAMPDSETPQEQDNHSSGIYQGKSKAPAEVCNRKVRNKSKTNTTTVIWKW